MTGSESELKIRIRSDSDTQHCFWDPGVDTKVALNFLVDIFTCLVRPMMLKLEQYLRYLLSEIGWHVETKISNILMLQ